MSFNNYNGYGTESAPMPPNLFLPAIHLVKRHSALKVLALCSSPRAGPDSSRVVAPGPWKHIAELEYIGPNHPSIAAWNDLSIVTYLAHTAITIPPRSDSRSDPWVAISSNDGNAPATLPRGYRIPLLWIAKVQWESLQLLLTVARPLWDLVKYDILHLARLTTQFLEKARNEPRIKRQWRDPMFDRALTRFFNGWMGCSEMFIYDFYREFKDEEYKDDLLARRWAQKVPKGIRGYVLTEEELVDGITMEQFMAGLVINRENSTFEWTVEPEVEQPPVTDPQPPELPLGGGISRREDEKEPPRTANSRGSSPLTSEQGSDIDMIAESLNPKASASTSTSEPPTPLLTRPESISTRAPPPPPIQTGSELPRKKSHKAKSRSSKTDRPDKASRPIRTRTSSSISAMSPATPKIAHLSRSDMSSAASSPNRTPSGFDFTAPIESRGRKRKIESVYSVSPSPLTSDSEDEDESSTGKGSTRGPKNPNRPSSRPVQSATPDGRAFTMNSRIVIPRLSNPEVYSRPQTSMYPVPVEGLPTSTASTSGVPSVVIKTPRKASTTSETPSPRKVAKSPVVPLHHYKLYAISSSPSTNPFDPTNPATSIPPFHNWRHPDELAYIGPSHPDAGTWTDVRVVTYMVDNAFSIPSRNADSKQTWVEVRVKVDGGEVVTTTLPRGYRIPLLWLGKVQWDCLKLLLTTGRDQWPALRFDVLHIARLAAEFMAKARKEVKMKRQYRNVMFDRALSRFFNGWMGSRDEFVWDFYREFRDEEYEDDMLQRRWLQKAVKGIQGFAVTEHELHEGITAEQFMEGLNLDRERGTYEWIDPDAPAAPSSPVPAIEEAAAASPMTMEPEPFPVIEPAPQPQPRTQTVPAAEPLKPQSTLRVEVAPRGHSPLSLSQVAGVRSASSSPLTPVFVDHHMDVDPPAQPQEQEQPAAVSAAAVAPAVVESPPPSDLLPEPEQVQTEQQSSVVVNDAEPLATPEALADSGQLPPVQVFPSVQSSEIVNHAEPLVTREPSPVHVQLGPDGVPGAAAPSVPEPAPPAAEDNATERPAPIDDEPPAPRRWTSPLRSATPSAIDDGVGAEDVPMEDADVVGTPLPSLDLDEQAFHGPSNANNNMNMDDMDGLDELEADFIRYTPPPKTESAIRNPFLLGPQPVPHPAGLLGSTNSLIQPQPQEEEDVDFNEADYIRSRLPSPFAATPPAQSLQPESPKPRAMSPLAEPAAMSPLAQPAPTSPLAEPVAMSPLTEPAAEPVPSSPRPASPHSESIRSSSSPEPRHPELPEQSEPQSRGSVPPEGEDATEHRLPSLPPDSDEEGPAPEPVQANEPVVQVDEPVVQVAEPVVQVDEPTADDPAQINELAKVDDAPAAATVQTTERPTEQGAANATVATQAPAEVEVAHIVPLSPADAIDDFPPGFHFMGMPHGTPLQSNLSQTLFSQPSQDAAAAAPSQTQSAAQNNGSHPSDVVQVRPTAEVSRASASPSNADRAQSLVVDAPLTTRLSPETVSAETVLSTLKHNDDSKRVKLEIMTVSLSNGKNGTVEDEEDMDIETPIDVDMEGSLSPPPVSAPSRVASPPSDSQSVLPPSRMASPPLSASQSLFTPDTTPRSANTSAATFSNAARIAAANLASHLASPSISAGRAASSPVSQQSNDEMVAPGLSSIGRPSFPMHDANNFRRTPTPNRSPSLAGPGVRLSAPPMASLNGHRNSSATGRPSPTQNMSGNHMNGSRDSGKPSGPPAQNMSGMNGNSPTGYFVNGGGSSRLFLRDKPVVHPLPQRPDVRMDGGGIRIPDTSNEYDPRQRDPIVLGPSSSYSISGMQPRMGPGMQPNMQPNHQPNMGPGMQPNHPPNMGPSMQPNHQSNMGPSMQTDMHRMQSNHQPNMGPGPGMQPGMQSNHQPNMGPGMQPNHQPNMGQSDMQRGRQPNMPPDMHRMQPNHQPNTGPGMQHNHPPNMGPGMQPNHPPNMGPGMQPNHPPNMGPGMQPNHPPNMGPGMQLNHPPNMGPGMQSGINHQPNMGPPGLQPNMQSGMQPNMQSNTQPGPSYPRWMGYSGPPAPGGYHPPYSPLVSLNRAPPQTIPSSPSMQGPPQILPQSPSLHAPPQVLPISVQLPPSVQPPPMPPSMPPPPMPPSMPSPSIPPFAQPSPSTNGRLIARPPSARVTHTPDIEMPKAQSTVIPIPIPAIPARAPSLPPSANDSVRSPPRTPSVPSPVVPSVSSDLILPEVNKAPQTAPPAVNGTPEIEMEIEDSPRRSRSPSAPASGAPPQALSDPSSTALPFSAPAPIVVADPSVPGADLSPPHAHRAPEIDMRSLENALVLRLKQEMRSQLKDELKSELRGELRGELEGELRGELKGELTGQLKGQLKGELKDELKGELKGELRGELKNELRDELKNELKDELKAEVKGELLVQIREEMPGRMKQELLGQLREDLLVQIKDDLLLRLKDDLLAHLKAELLTQLKAELLVQLQDDLLLRLKDELLRQLQTELHVLLKDDLKAQLTDDLTIALKNVLRDQLRADLKDDMILELKNHFTEQLKDQLRVLLVQLKGAVNSQLRDDLIIQLKYFIAKLKEELIVQLKDTLTVHLKDGLITQVKAALTAQLRDGLGAQREQLNLDFERRRLFLEQQPRIKAVKPASPAVATTPLRPTPTTPRPTPSLLFQARHPLHHLVLETTPDFAASMDVDAPPSNPPTPSLPPSLPASPSKPKGNETPLPVKSQRKQSWFATGYQASQTPEAS